MCRGTALTCPTAHKPSRLAHNASPASSRQGAGETELREHAGVEAGHGADTAAAEGKDDEPGRVEDTGLRVPGVEAERGLAIGPGRDNASPAAGAEPGGSEEPGDRLAAVVLQRERQHGHGDVLG